MSTDKLMNGDLTFGRPVYVDRRAHARPAVQIACAVGVIFSVTAMVVVLLQNWQLKQRLVLLETGNDKLLERVASLEVLTEDKLFWIKSPMDSTETSGPVVDNTELKNRDQPGPLLPDSTSQHRVKRAANSVTLPFGVRGLQGYLVEMAERGLLALLVLPGHPAQWVVTAAMELALLGRQDRPGPKDQMAVAFTLTRKTELGPVSTSADLTVTFDHVLTDVGGSFTGVSNPSFFNVEHPGVYQFSFSALSQVTKSAFVKLMKNGQFQLSMWAGYGPSYGSGSNTAVLELEQGDRVWLALRRPDIYALHSNIWRYVSFTGVLLYST
ncbi:CAPRIN2 [Branchiostoma lanceolatum]|uniref:CAPRIN2 protein n=1 Tax=Branchiostoma lanceolatum TaxID=7740 RepID=A0A8J9YZC3_BRALA|nr:CAPRIN2 [Branchiostoma lanceolatum]